MGRYVAHSGPPSLRRYRWVQGEADALPGEVVEFVEGKALSDLMAMEEAWQEARAEDWDGG